MKFNIFLHDWDDRQGHDTWRNIKYPIFHVFFVSSNNDVKALALCQLPILLNAFMNNDVEAFALC
jgi:hypothetical protein